MPYSIGVNINHHKEEEYKLKKLRSDDDDDDGPKVVRDSVESKEAGSNAARKRRKNSSYQQLDKFIEASRKKSRQEYLKSRIKKKLKDLGDDLEDEKDLFEGVKLSRKEYLDVKHKKEVYAIVKKNQKYESDDSAVWYNIPESYDQEGKINQAKRFSVAFKVDGGFEKQESWEKSLLRKGLISFGSKDRVLESDRYELLFDEIYKLEEQLPGQSVDDQKRVLKKIKNERMALPIYPFKKELLKAIKDHQVLVIIGETGSGKTTQIPQYLHEAGYTKNGKIACTQPRRVAAISVAARVSEEMDVKLGHEVGYSIRFEDCTSKKTVLKYLTDGRLLQEFMSEPDLRSYSVVIVDEAHERTVSTDLLFGLLKDLTRFREDFKLLITSATLQAEKFSDFFDSAPIFEIPGRQYPVDIFYKEPMYDYLEEAIAAALNVHLSQPAGDILVFLTGQEEIETAEEILKNKIEENGSRFASLIICPIFSNLPTELQAKVFDPTPEGARKIVLATNIAETSVTIDKIRYVIDSGFCKLNVYDPETDVESLQITKISKASALQRAGRAGRTGPGKCIRLYRCDDYHYEFKETCIPEIQRSNIANEVLTLKKLGISDLVNFDFMDPPSDESLLKALELLYGLGALNSRGEITRLGKLMAEFPIDPKLSKALIASEKYGCSEEIATVAAMLSVGNSVFYRPKDRLELADNAKKIFEFGDDGDHIALLRVYNSWKQCDFSSQWCYGNFIQVRSMKRARDIRDQLVGLMERVGITLKSNTNNLNAIKKAIMSGFFSHVAARQATAKCYNVVKGVKDVHIHPQSGLAKTSPPPKWVIYHELGLPKRTFMRQVTAVRPEWLLEIAPHYYKIKEVQRIGKMI